MKPSVSAFYGPRFGLCMGANIAFGQSSQAREFLLFVGSMAALVPSIEHVAKRNDGNLQPLGLGTPAAKQVAVDNKP